MNDRLAGWLKISELAALFGVSEESLKRLAKTHGLPLRRLTPYATPGVLESELFRWLKKQPPVGRPIRSRAKFQRKPDAKRN